MVSAPIHFRYLIQSCRRVSAKSDGGPMTFPITSRRSSLGLAAASTLGAMGLAACGSAGPAQSGGGAASGGGGGAATMWGLTGKPGETIRKNAVDAFNKLGKGTIEVTAFQNDPYKAKIR